MAIKDDVLAYLNTEKEIILAEQEAAKQWTVEEKIEKGVLIHHAKLVEIEVRDTGHKLLTFEAEENNSKFRAGDTIHIFSEDQKMTDALMVENGLHHISLQVPGTVEIEEEKIYDLAAAGFCLLDNIIALLNEIQPGASGYAFLQRISFDPAEREEYLFENPVFDEQKTVYEQAEKIASSVSDTRNFCIQGPPGAGKTALLAKVTRNLLSHGKKVLIVANTHQAVNNALNAVLRSSPEKFVAKVGHWLKRDSLLPEVRHYKNLWTCASSMNREKANNAVVGMTFLSAVLEVGLNPGNQNRYGFIPDAVLVDEASQIPLPYAAVLGRFRAPSTIFFGDENQMPPIFRTELKNSPLSISIFKHLKYLYPGSAVTLDKTYRMNNEICSCIRRYFYPEVDLQPGSEEIAQRRLSQVLMRRSDQPAPTIQHVVFNDDSSIQIILSENPSSTDSNEEEARMACELVVEAKKLLRDNWNKRIAVITPFRRQLRLIRSLLLTAGIPAREMPLVDTVERLQGQQVDMIILSFCSSDPAYIRKVAGFLFDINRTNVMISRAKTKVVILASHNVIHFSNSCTVCNLLQEYCRNEK